jgi:Uma2 family endonuclease
VSRSSEIANLSIEEYLKLEESSAVRHEYIAGHIFAMAGSSEAHNVICVNLVALLHAHLSKTGCRVFTNDMRVKIEAANSFYYPDIMVTCEPIDAKSVFKKAPILIAEVLSPSTKHIDRREKLMAYRQLPSLIEYVIVHQDRYRIEVYRMNAEQLWQGQRFGKSDILSLNSMPSGVLEMSVNAIYEPLSFESVVEEDGEEYQV